MKKYLIFSLFAAVLSLSFVQLKKSQVNQFTVTKPTVADSLKAAMNYKNLCGKCHGEKVDAFVDRNWKNGSSNESLYKSIKQGNTGKGMPSFENTLSDDEIVALSNYIGAGITRLKSYSFGAPQTSNVFT
jgi:mono/diheme cytochrome c family protein